MSIISNPIPWVAASAIKSRFGMQIELPVPSIMSSGSKAIAGSRSARVREVGSETFQSFSRF